MSRSVPGLRLVFLLVAVAMGCADTQSPHATIEAPVEAGAECSVSEGAWVRRAMLAVWGRRPMDSREVAVWSEMADQLGRADTVRAMMKSPQARSRFAELIQDLLAINRFGERVNDACARRELPEVTPALATHVRDAGPLGVPFDAAWTFSDLIESAIALDDISPVFRAALFAQLGSRVIDADDIDDEVAFRQLYASIFERAFLNRRMDCLRCHNSEYSVVETHFPLPGHVERAVFENSAGRADADLSIFFRVTGVLSMNFIPEATGLDFWEYGPGERPWGMSPECGQFVAPDAITPDPLGSSGWFVRAFGPTASIWDLEGLLRAGFDALRGRELPVDATTQDVPGEAAFAWLVSMRIAEGVWEAQTGHRLTTPNFFPRNPDQRDLLRALAETFVTEGYSLTELMVAILDHPWFMPAAPADCPNAETAYVLPAIYDPWVDQSEIEEQRNNSVGDLVGRVEPRVLLTAAAAALEWSEPDLLALLPEESDGEEEEPEGVVRLALLQTDLGQFVSDSETGFRGSNFRETLAWEEALGHCEPPWEAEPRPPDFIDRLVETAEGRTLADLATALKDRIVTEPELSDPDERALLEALAGVSLDTPVAELPSPAEPLRRICAALLASPQFVLDGIPLPQSAGTSWAPTGATREDHCAAAQNLAPSFKCES